MEENALFLNGEWEVDTFTTSTDAIYNDYLGRNEVEHWQFPINGSYITPSQNIVPSLPSSTNQGYTYLYSLYFQDDFPQTILHDGRQSW